MGLMNVYGYVDELIYGWSYVWMNEWNNEWIDILVFS